MTPWYRLLLCAILLACCNPVGQCLGQEQAKVTLLVPAYFYPAGEGLVHWRALVAAAGDVSVVAVANPNNGPGQQRDENYAKVITAATKRGLRVIGYVATGYGKRPLADVTADIDRWIKFYPEVSGVFLDEQASDAPHVSYYTALGNHARQRIKKALVVSNPGTSCAPEYFASGAADVICVFENRTGFDKFRAPPRVSGDRTARCVLLHDVRTVEQMRTALQHAKSQGVTHLYITDDHGANPWDRLPSYWRDEVTALQQ